MNDYYKVNAISNSALGYYLKSPLHFKKYVENSGEDKDSDAFGLGKIVHKYTLESDTFDEQYEVMTCKEIDGLMGEFIREYVRTEFEEDMANIPLAYEKSGFKQSTDVVFKNFQKPENQAYYTYLKGLMGKSSCSAEEVVIAGSISNNIKEHKTANELIYPVETKDIMVLTEVEVYWDYIREGIKLPCKAKIDRIIIDLKLFTIKVVELKTTGYPARYFEKAIRNFKYYRQLAWYEREALKQLLGQYNLDISKFVVSSYIVAVETTDLNQVRVIKLSNTDLVQGEIEYEWILEQIDWHKKVNFWYKKDYYFKEDWVDEISIFNENVQIDDKTKLSDEGGIYQDDSISITDSGQTI